MVSTMKANKVAEDTIYQVVKHIPKDDQIDIYISNYIKCKTFIENLVKEIDDYE